MRSRSQKQHSWTDEELEILSYLRYTRHWRFKQIQETYFPLLSSSALRGAYWYQSTEDRIRRASKASNSITDPRNSEKGCPGLASKKQPFISNKRNWSRYNLRPNRPSVFPPKEPQYLVDRQCTVQLRHWESGHTTCVAHLSLLYQPSTSRAGPTARAGGDDLEGLAHQAGLSSQSGHIHFKDEAARPIPGTTEHFSGPPHGKPVASGIVSALLASADHNY